MRNILAGNISRYRKDLKLTQEGLAEKLGLTFQAVSKWETGQSMPETSLLPMLARTLGVSVDKLLGYSAFGGDVSFYEDDYRKEEYFWGVEPSNTCLKVLELMPPIRSLKLLDIGCGEGKDAVLPKLTMMHSACVCCAKKDVKIRLMKVLLLWCQTNYRM